MRAARWIQSKLCARKLGIAMQQDFKENLQLAFDTVRTHKLRVFLPFLV